MTEVTMIGLDLAKNVFQVHGVDASGKTVIRRQLRRGQFCPSSRSSRPVWWAWRPAPPPTIGRVRSKRWGTGYG